MLKMERSRYKLWRSRKGDGVGSVGIIVLEEQRDGGGSKKSDGSCVSGGINR